MYILGRKDASWSQYALLFAVFLSDNFLSGYKFVGAGFLRPGTNEQTSATSCHRKKMLIMLDVEYWNVKSLQTVPRFYVDF
jgi:hypothetical protein